MEWSDRNLMYYFIFIYIYILYLLYLNVIFIYIYILYNKKLHGLSPRAKYTDW
jgi:hypothetical protein